MQRRALSMSGWRRRAVRLSLMLTLVAAGASAEGAAHPGWKTYGNSRYGYSACYPSAVFRPRPEPDAHDGVLFDGPSETTLSVSGEWSAPSNLREVLDLIVKTLDGHVTYQAAGHNWRVASGRARELLFYSRVIAGDGVIAQYVFVYPAKRSGEFSPVIKGMNTCMKIG